MTKPKSIAPATREAVDTARSGDQQAPPAQSAVQLKASLRGHDYATQVQMLAPEAPSGRDVHAAAAEGISGGGGALPHKEKIQQSVGGYDISNVQAHTDGAAAGGAAAMGADAYATGNHVVLGKGGDTLHTVAHEVAHVVQQRAGVALSGGVGKSGDVYEKHADAVGDAVVAGKSAEGLLGEMAGSAAGVKASRNIQMKPDPRKTVAPAESGTAKDAKDGIGPAAARKALPMPAQDSTGEMNRGFDALAKPGMKEADAPNEINLPRAVRKGMQDSWDRSLPGDDSQEQGGNAVRDKNGFYEWRPGPKGESSHFTPAYQDFGANQELVGIGHTHPYSEVEGGYTDMSFSGGDLSALIWQTQPVSLVQSGETLFVVARTAEFNKHLEGMDHLDKDDFAIEIEGTWDEEYQAKESEGQVAAAESATRVTCAKYHLVYYRGQGGKLTKSENPR